MEVRVSQCVFPETREKDRLIERALIITVIIIDTVNRGDNSKVCYINNVDPPQSTGMGNITLGLRAD